MLKSVIFVAIFGLALAKSITFKDCGSVGGKLISVDMSPCTEEPCQLKRGTNYTATVNFTATETSQTAKTVVHGIIAGIPVPFPVPADCCQYNNLKCPMTATTQIYTNSIYCSPNYPELKLVAKWEVQDDNGKDIFCFLVPLEIVA